MRLLQKIINVNKGYLLGLSPYNKNHQDGIEAGFLDEILKESNDVIQFYWNGNKIYEEQNGKKSYFTEWNAILPLSYQWENKESKLSAEKMNTVYFGNEIQKPPEQLIYLSEEAIFKDAATEDKWKNIQIVHHNLNYCIEPSQQKSSIIVLKSDSGNIGRIEVLAKALFALIADEKFRNTKMKLRIALILPDMVKIQEFIRIFSAFYFDGEQEDMESTQIALCAKSTIYHNTYAVEFMLQGTYLENVVQSAALFAYHHAEDTAKHLPVLDYLTKDNKANEKQPSSAKTKNTENPDIFPFDLFLPNEFPKEPAKVEDLKNTWTNNWFKQRISQILHENIRRKTYGCLIDKVHVRLGSKLHIDRFFEAELLFHNTGDITRFAYLIAQDLLYGEGLLAKDQNVLLLGYEKYSTSLILQIEYWLKQSRRYYNVCSAIVYDGQKPGEVQIQKNYYSEELSEKIKYKLQVVTVLPVGSTLSTIYKMHNTAARKLAQEFPILRNEYRKDHNYCLVLVNNDLMIDSCGGNEITRKYWKSIDRARQKVSVMPENKDSQNISVKYLIPAYAEWINPEECYICNRTGKDCMPLIDVKCIETAPLPIFNLYGDQYRHCILYNGKEKADPQDKNSDTKEERNWKRIGSLFQNIYYAHICEDNNHFQFYMKFERLYLENKADIDMDLRKYTVDRKAFNVVISPLDVSKSAFAKAVVDNVFLGCVRFFNFNMLDAYREEIRSKFSYISQDYELLKRENPQAKFCIHFVDNSIVTDETLTRAKLLMRMLLQQTNIPENNITMFDHVFVLVNRCHPDTINSFVAKPEENLYAYIYLKIPYYNTANDICPACRLKSKYELLKKRSSTESISREFARLAEKHKKREYLAYPSWKEENLLKQHSCFSWLMQWLYVNGSDDESAIESLLSFVPDEANTRYARLKNLTGTDMDKKDFSRAVEVKKIINDYFKNNLLPVIKDGDDRMRFNSRQNYLIEYESRSLKDVVCWYKKNGNESSGSRTCENESFQDMALALLWEQIVAVRNYMRLVTLEEAYEKLEQTPVNEKNEEQQLCRKTIVDMIAERMIADKNSMPENLKDKFSKIPDQRKERFRISYNAEWIISYIKVLSREQLANYYDYRQAIAGIMMDMLDIITPNPDDHNKETLIAENPKWEKIWDVLREFSAHSEDKNEKQLRAQYHFQIYMTLVHRMADMQINLMVSADSTYNIIKLYDSLLDYYFNDLTVLEAFPYIELPSAEKLILRYLKAVKTATMISNDANPCLKLTRMPEKLREKANGETAGTEWNLRLCARYIYLENTLMLYYGMRDLNLLISPDVSQKLCQYRPAERFKGYIEILQKEVYKNLAKSYSNLDKEGKESEILQQNLLNNFCRFWHRSTNEAPVAAKMGKNSLKITYMLQYFRRLSSITDEKMQLWKQPDQLPYIYEEICRSICGFTDSDMCYIIYAHAGRSPEIFTQSGYYAPYIRKGKILNAERAESLLRRVHKAWQRAGTEFPHGMAENQDQMLVPNVAKLHKKGEDDFLILGISSLADEGDKPSFYIVLQKSEQKGENIKNEENQPTDENIALRKARDILFMRQTLQEALSRDYTVLISFRFDCSYIRSMSSPLLKTDSLQNTEKTKGTDIERLCPVNEEFASALHLSDLHIKIKSDVQALKDRISGTIQKSPENFQKIDLLIITGDIVDSREANALLMEENYQKAEELLEELAIKLWQDKSEYLPHDWRRRVIITTGNHDFAAMNQYQTAMKHRALTAAMPIETESGTMSKFAYYIDFLIRFLDPPVDELLRNDLNEIRYYRKLNLKVLALNCSGLATPRRTNKIGVNAKRVRMLLDHETWENSDDEKDRAFRICVAHYSPGYNLSYLLDAYHIMPGWTFSQDEEKGRKSQVNELVGLFCTIMVYERKIQSDNWLVKADEKPKESQAADAEENKNSLNNKRQELNKEMKYLNEALYAIKSGKNENSLRAEVHKFYADLTSHTSMPPDKLVKKMQENELYKQIDYYCKWNQRTPSNTADERIAKMINDITDCIFMSRTDKEEFEKIINEAGEIDLFLAGHVHAYSEQKSKPDDRPDEEQTDDSARYMILVADQAFSENVKDMHGYVIKNMAVKEGDEKEFSYCTLGISNALGKDLTKSVIIYKNRIAINEI